MSTATVRELRNHGGRVLERVLAGEHVVVTRDGTPVAELRPVRAPAVEVGTLLERWRRLPVVDPPAARADIDAVFDPSL